MTFFVCICLFIFGSLNLGAVGQKANLQVMWGMGFGTVNPSTIISWRLPSSGAKGLIGNVLAANSAQVILSFVYFTYNGIYTCMSLGVEWQNYMPEPKGLRVSTVPAGAQRSTYFLQLPYRFALPLMGMSGILHWLLSQSLFLVYIESYVWDDDSRTYLGTDSNPDFGTNMNMITCGWSPFALLLVILAQVVLVVAVVAIGRRRFKTGMPIASTRSIAIAAACHPDAVEWEEAKEKGGGKLSQNTLQWGVTGEGVDGVGHCSFSSKEVSTPTIGALYA
jgi:hypothetical protein